MKTVCIILGTVSLTLGIIGIFLPLLPTTPFLLLTAALYFRGSPRLYQWLLNHKCLGPYIRSFRENKAIPLRAKIISLLLMWGTMVYCIFFLIPLTEIKTVLFLVAVGVTWHILSFKTLKLCAKLLLTSRRILPTPSGHRQTCFPNVSRSSVR